MRFDAVKVSSALRNVGLDLDPSHFLDDPPEIAPGRYACLCIGRMCFENIGTKEVSWTGSKWEIAKGWLSRINAPTGETVFDDNLGQLAK